MGDQHHRDAKGFIQVLQQMQNGFGGLRIQRRGSFIAQQHAGIVGKSSGNGDPLFLTAGELLRISVSFIADPHQLQQALNLVCGLLLAQSAAPQGIGHISRHRPGRHQVEVLKDHPDLLPGLAQLLYAQGCDLLSVHRDRTGVRPLQKIDTAHQRGFSCAGESDDPENLPRPDGQGYVLNCMNLLLTASKILGNMCQLNQINSSFNEKSGKLKSSPLQMCPDDLLLLA